MSTAAVLSRWGALLGPVWLSLSVAHAETPLVCTGFIHHLNRYGTIGAPDRTPVDECDEGSAFLAHLEVYRHDAGRMRQTPYFGSCCPLPPEALTGEAFDGGNECPDGSVAVGAGMKPWPATGSVSQREYYLRCRRVNTARYRLGELSPGWQIGPYADPVEEWWDPLVSGAMHASSLGRIPAQLRAGIFRRSEDRWSYTGCIGHPWGSVMTGRLGQGCGDFRFRELLPLAVGVQGVVQPAACSSITSLGSDARCVSPAPQ